MARGIFVTGTDTGVGKTVIAAALLRALAAESCRAVGMKPVAAGLDKAEDAADAVAADTRALIAAGNVDAPARDVGPYVFAPPIAPELAARAAGVIIDLDVIAAAYARLAAGAQLFIHIADGRLGGERQRLRKCGDAQVTAVRDPARVRFLKLGEHAQQGGLAGPVEADDAHPGVVVQPQGYVGEQLTGGSVALVHPVQIDDVGHDVPRLPGRPASARGR